MIRKQVMRFLLVGGTTVLIDFICYSAMIWFSAPTGPAKAVSFSIGAVFAYFANRSFTFTSSARGPRRFLLFSALYLTTLGVNVVSNETALEVLGFGPVQLVIAFVFATGLSATLNFLGMKFFIFKEQRSDA